MDEYRDRVVTFQVMTLEACKKKWNIDGKMLMSICNKFKIVEFIGNNYELLHINGELAVVDEIERYIIECGGDINAIRKKH